MDTCNRRNPATTAWTVTVAAAICLTLSGCGDGDSSHSPGPNSHPNAEPTTTSLKPGAPTPTPEIPRSTNIWQWRSDMPIGQQITYDLSGNMNHNLYGACWDGDDLGQGVPENLAAGLNGEFQHTPADKQFEENKHTYGKYRSDVGLTLSNLRNESSRPGCLVRKSRLPIDLSTINRMELDIRTSGGTAPKAPWFAVWLAPVLYNQDTIPWSAEIDFIENYDFSVRGSDSNSLATNFAGCGEDWAPGTESYCKTSSWGGSATDVDHHMSLHITDHPTDGRVVHVNRCRNPHGSTLKTCVSGDDAWMKISKPGPAGSKDWFKIWNKEVAGPYYGHYWLVSDIWFTSGTDFKLEVDNVKFFKQDGTEWKMPLDGLPPRPPIIPTVKGNIVV